MLLSSPNATCSRRHYQSSLLPLLHESSQPPPCQVPAKEQSDPLWQHDPWVTCCEDKGHVLSGADLVGRSGSDELTESEVQQHVEDRFACSRSVLMHDVLASLGTQGFGLAPDARLPRNVAEHPRGLSAHLQTSQ